MPLRPPAGFRSAFYDPLKVADAPTAPAASGGDAQASVTFTAPSNVGGSAITQYYAVSDPSQITGNAASSPVTVTGLTNGTAYTFRVWALNSYGPSPYSAATGSVTPAALTGVFFGGTSTVRINVIQYISISTLGNSSDFGDLLSAESSVSACGSLTRGVSAGGYHGGGAAGQINVIQYIEFSTTGNSTDFGDLSANSYTGSGCSNTTRGLFSLGYTTAASNVIEYITIASVGNSIDFGDLTLARYSSAGCSSSTRGVFAGGFGSANSNVIDYVTIASVGNATDFGDLTAAKSSLSGCSSTTRGVFGGGQIGGTNQNVIEYITIATTGNATDFGDLLSAIQNPASCSSTTRGIWGGGFDSARINVIQYITISSTGNASDFGDLLAATYEFSATSNCHGGLS